MIRKLLDATLSVDDLVARKQKTLRNRKRQRRNGNKNTDSNDTPNESSRKQKLLLIHVPLQVICEHIPKFLFPEEALRLSVVCKGTLGIAKRYDRTSVGKRNLHHLAVESFNPKMVGMISLDCALRKTCGICGVKFMGTFCSKYLSGRLYAHENCVMDGFINLENVGIIYGLGREDLPANLKIWDLRLPRKRYAFDQIRTFSNFWIWNKCCDMIPLKWTFEWVLYHDKTVREKVIKYIKENPGAVQTYQRNYSCFRREFLLSQYKELRHPLFFEGVMYPTRVQLAKKLGEGVDVFGDFFKVTRSGSTNLTLDDACVKALAITVRAFDLVQELKTMQVAYDHIVKNEAVDCGNLTLEHLLRDSNTRDITKKCLASCLSIDGEESISPQRVVDVWKKFAWHKVRLARVAKLKNNPKLHWVVEFQFEDVVGDYLTAWIPETTYGDIGSYVTSLFHSSEFQKAGVARPSRSDITAFNNYLSYQRTRKDISVAEALDLGECVNVTEKAIKLCKRLANIKKEMEEQKETYNRVLRNSSPQSNYLQYLPFHQW